MMRCTEQFRAGEVASWGPFDIDHTLDDQLIHHAGLAASKRGALTATPKQYTITIDRLTEGHTPIADDYARTGQHTDMVFSVTFTVEENTTHA